MQLMCFRGGNYNIKQSDTELSNNPDDNKWSYFRKVHFLMLILKLLFKVTVSMKDINDFLLMINFYI